jgi:MFS family permease
VLDCDPVIDGNEGWWPGVTQSQSGRSQRRQRDRETAVGSGSEPVPELTTEAPSTRFGNGMFAALAYRDYRLLWSGNMVTQTGRWMQEVATGWLMLELTDSPAWLGLVGFTRGLPMLLLSLPAGVLADRVDRRRLLVGAQALAAILATILAILVATDLVRPWHVLVLSFLSGSTMSFIFPTRQALVSTLVPRERMANAVAVNSAGQNSARVFGPSLAGVMISAVGTAICFAFQAVGLIAAAVMSFRLRAPSRDPQTTGTKASAAANLLEGLRYIAATPRLKGLIGLAAIPTVLAMPFMQMIPVIARDELGTGSAGLGLLMTASGIGALTGSLTVAALSTRMRSFGNLQIITAALFGVMVTLFAFSPWLPLSLVLVAMASGVSAVYMSLNNTILQMSVSDEFRGRVLSVYLMTWGLMPFGTLPMGALADAYGAPIAVATGGIASTVLVFVIAVKLPAIRRMSQTVDDPVQPSVRAGGAR